MTEIGAIVLAAGESRRMGQPKLTLPWGRTTVLGQVTATLTAAGVTDIAVITGGWRAEVEAEVARLAASLPVRAVFNPHYAQGGMLSSIQCGLRAMRPGCEAALIALGDQPQVSQRSVQAVLGALAQPGVTVVVPSWQRRRGHPILIMRPAWDDLLHWQPPLTLRDFLNQQTLTYVEADETIVMDLDTPESYQRQKP
ncbi:MAG: nucleotidyltransferase family protein [Anaerolineales bacterium]